MTLSMLTANFGGPRDLLLTEVSVSPPVRGEVTIDVRASGVNPSDLLNISGRLDNNPARLPVSPGYEVSGVISAIGPDTDIATGACAVGDPVVAFCIIGGYSSRVTVPADDVFRMPSTMSFPEGAGLLLSGTTAARMLDTVRAARDEVIVVHGASGATGVSVLQQAALLGARVIGTCSESSFDRVRRFGGSPVPYGPGLEDRIRELAPDGVDVALDCVGTDEAIDVSFALVQDRKRVVTIAAFPRAFTEDLMFFIGSGRGTPNDAFRTHVIELAEAGSLVVPLGRTFPLADAADALEVIASGHPGGKLALLSDAT